jgi:hypothetical protein
VLREVRRQVPALKATTRWDEFGAGECRLLLWEAFVSGSEKGAGHHEDAVFALRAFEKSLDRMPDASRIGGEAPISLAGTLILWAGLSDDLKLLHSPCIALRPVFDAEEAATRLTRWKAEAARKRQRRASGPRSNVPAVEDGLADADAE